MTYRAALVAGLGVAALTVATPGPASACRPEQFPYCQESYCAGLALLYRQTSENVSVWLPAWPQTGVAGCP